MPDRLHRLVYYSRNRIVDEGGVMQAEIASILAASRRNNAPVGITGALMFNAGCFGQVLEGRPAVLESTFERIQQDPRHSDVTLLAYDAVPERLFGQWSMGFVGARDTDAALFDGIGAASGFDPAALDGEALLAALKRLAMEEEALA